MSNDSAALLADVLGLPASEREEVAAALWDSLELEAGLREASEGELRAETAAKRAEILSGAVSPITHEELKRQLGR